MAGAERLVLEGLARLGWGEADLKTRRKGGAAEGGISLGIALADNDAAGVDCGALANGHPRTSGMVAPATREEPIGHTRRPVRA